MLPSPRLACQLGATPNKVKNLAILPQQQRSTNVMFDHKSDAIKGTFLGYAALAASL